MKRVMGGRGCCSLIAIRLGLESTADSESRRSFSLRLKISSTFQSGTYSTLSPNRLKPGASESKLMNSNNSCFPLSTSLSTLSTRVLPYLSFSLTYCSFIPFSS